MYHADGNSDTDISGTDAQITISAWINTDDGTGANQFIAAKYRASGDFRGYYLAVGENSGNERITGCIRNFANNDTQCGNTADNSVSANTWYHVATTYDDNTIIAYIDGVAGVDTGSSTGGINDTSGTFQLGFQGSFGAFENQYFDGEIDEVCIWDTALTAAEVAHLASSRMRGLCRQIKPSNLTFYAPLDNQTEGTALSGTYVVDKGTNLTAHDTPNQVSGKVLTYQ